MHLHCCKSFAVTSSHGLFTVDYWPYYLSAAGAAGAADAAGAGAGAAAGAAGAAAGPAAVVAGGTAVSQYEKFFTEIL